LKSEEIAKTAILSPLRLPFRHIGFVDFGVNQDVGLAATVGEGEARWALVCFSQGQKSQFHNIERRH